MASRTFIITFEACILWLTMCVSIRQCWLKISPESPQELTVQIKIYERVKNIKSIIE